MKKFIVFAVVILVTTFCFSISVNADTLTGQYWYPKYRVDIAHDFVSNQTSWLFDSSIVWFDEVGNDTMEDCWDMRVVKSQDVTFQVRFTENGSYQTFAYYTPTDTGYILYDPSYSLDSDYKVYYIYVPGGVTIPNAFYNILQQFFECSNLPYNSYYGPIADLVVAHVQDYPNDFGLYTSAQLTYYYNLGYGVGFAAGTTAGDNAIAAAKELILSDPNQYNLYNADCAVSLVTGESWLKSIANSVGSFLSIQVFPNITLGLLIFVPLLLGVMGLIFHFWRKD